MRPPGARMPLHAGGKAVVDAALRELLAPERVYPPSTSVVMLCWCTPCNEWCLEGSYERGYCVTCGTLTGGCA
jgi:hypothetical protein